MIAKLRSFKFSAWTHKRGPREDAEIPPGESVEADQWLEMHGALLMPADPCWWDGETEEPSWDAGAYLADPRTGRLIPGTNSGRPQDWMIEAWRSGRRTLDGVIIASPTPEKNGDLIRGASAAE